MAPRKTLGEIGKTPQFLQQNYGRIRRGKVKIPMQRSNWVYRINKWTCEVELKIHSTPDLYGPKMNTKIMSQNYGKIS
jgi:hypothetical protein